MPNSVKYEDLREFYINHYKTVTIDDNRVEEISSICDKIEKYKHIYDRITKQSRSTVPWWFIGAIHYRESNFSFARHIHNGDPLSARTTNVPANRPLSGNPPFTFEDSVSDIIEYKSLNKETSWHLVTRTLWLFEKYNGFGYIKYHNDVMSPYIWGGTDKYVSGGYASDGKFKEFYVSKQIGCAPIVKTLVDRNLISFEDIPKHIVPITNPATGTVEVENILQNLGK